MQWSNVDSSIKWFWFALLVGQESLCKQGYLSWDPYDKKEPKLGKSGGGALQVEDRTRNKENKEGQYAGP